jgi:hypothetical protein
MQIRKGRSGTLVGASLLALFPPAILVACFHANAAVVLIGAATWALAQPVKRLVYRLAARLLSQRLGPAEWAAVRGFVSAGSELASSGVYLLFFLPSPTLPNLLGFGAGASSAEILFLLTPAVVRRLLHRGGSRFQLHTEEAQRSLCIRYLFLIERFAALLLHVGSRCLVSMSLSQHNLFAGLWAVVSFSLVDGLAAFGKLRAWNWFDPHICRRFYGIVLFAGASDLALFAVMAGYFR